MIKWIILAIFVISTLYIQNRGKVRHSFYRQFFDHSTILAPINFLMYIFSKVPNQPYIDTQHFKDLKVLDENWEMIRDEAKALYAQGGIKASSTYNDLGFNSFFKTGWKRFYLKWYDSAHPSAAELCPKTTALLKTYIHYAENGTDENRIIFFADVERPLKTRLMEKFNHWFGKNVMTAASSPNETGDQTGGLNKAFGYVYQIRLKAKALKAKNRKLYYFLKWFLMLGIFFLIFIRPYMPQIIEFFQKIL